MSEQEAIDLINRMMDKIIEEHRQLIKSNRERQGRGG